MDGYVAIIMLGFGLGLMHALDADHVMAVSTLSNAKPGITKILKFCTHWALGHSGVLLVSGLLLFGLGINIPPALLVSAELLVGVLLIALGLWCFYSFRKQALQLVEHSHEDVTHTHWHIKEAVSGVAHEKLKAKEAHTPVMVGVVHGLAGSAPALALVPAVAQGALTSALVYLLVFSLGVMLAMLVFGLGFGAAQQYLQQRHVVLFNRCRYAIAAASVIIGGYWVSQAL